MVAGMTEEKGKEGLCSTPFRNGSCGDGGAASQTRWARQAETLA